PLLFMTGPYQGTKVGSSGRAVVVTRSPLTECYIDTYIGGNIGHDLRKAGWDGLFITGASESWVRLEISDHVATLHPADDLLGKTTWETEQALAALGECLSIGPAGENGVRIASPLTAGRRAAGRGGTGASFGFKRLKAFTVRASKEAAAQQRHAEDFSLTEAIKEQRKEMGTRRKYGDPFYAFGTSRGPIYAAENGRMPTANYTSTDAQIPELSALKVGGGQGGQTAKAVRAGAQAVPVVSAMDTHELSGEHWHESLPDAKQSGCCAPCPIACEAADRPTVDGVKMRGRPVHVNRVDRPEYETLAMMGANLGIGSSLDVMDGNDAANRMGIDTISGGAALSFMCEVALRGWLPDGWSDRFEAPFAFGSFAKGDLVPWAFGVPELPPLALHLLAHATPGDGTLFGTLAGGAVAASEHIEAVTGHPTTRLTAHCKGLDLPAWDPRGKRGNAMAYMTANVGASHMRAGYKAPTGLPNRSAVDLMEELVDSQHGIVIRDSMILCAFAKGATPDHVMVQAWKATTGEDCTWEDLKDRARVQWDQARRWNVEHWERQGKSAAEEDLLSWRLRREPIPSGVAAGMVSFVDDDDEAACMAAYYEHRGWTSAGVPVN
ncbi:MAG: aldehyde ferredoxin oxidoreductase C-terminal domain-containing protein, partial [Candidatus Thermoplasmatota archaeon]|nr:aldehyde ferredoxin oxidoreductase C-terminal domain-containing protein [Candidatus Thermoplasmatota archaeon]